MHLPGQTLAGASLQHMTSTSTNSTSRPLRSFPGGKTTPPHPYPQYCCGNQRCHQRLVRSMFWPGDHDSGNGCDFLPRPLTFSDRRYMPLGTATAPLTALFSGTCHCSPPLLVTDMRSRGLRAVPSPQNSEGTRIRKPEGCPRWDWWGPELTLLDYSSVVSFYISERICQDRSTALTSTFFRTQEGSIAPTGRLGARDVAKKPQTAYFGQAIEAERFKFHGRTAATIPLHLGNTGF